VDPVDHDDVEVLVVVVIEEGPAVPVDLNDIVLGGTAVDVGERQAGVPGDVDERHSVPPPGVLP